MVSRLISFFGPDGAGKSTHVRLLIEYFRSKGIKVKGVWIRSPHTLAFLLSHFLVRIGFYRVATNPYGMRVKVPAVNSNRTIRVLWSLVELISVLPLIMLRVYIPLILGYTIVAERYVVDTVVTIGYFIDDMGFPRNRVARVLLCFIPTNTAFVYLDSDYSTIEKRRGSTVEPYEFINFQRKSYDSIKKSLPALYIDTSILNIEETFSKIVNWLETSEVLSR